MGSGRIFLLLLLSVLSVSNVPATDGNSDSVITSVQEAHNLSPNKAIKQIPVRVTGTVTYIDPVWNMMFVQDGVSCIFVHGVEDHTLQQRDVVSIIGHTAYELAPFIEASSTKKIGEATLPEAVQLSLPLDSVPDCQFAELELTIQQATVLQERCILFSESGGQNFYVSIVGNYSLKQASAFVGCRFRVKGAMGYKLEVPPFHKPGVQSSAPTIIGLQIFAQSESQLTAVREASETLSDFVLKQTSITSLRNQADPSDGYQLYGNITWKGPKSVVIQHELAAMQFPVRDTTELHVGELASLLLIRDNGRGENRFRVPVISPLLKSQLPQPIVSQIESIDRASYLRVNVQADVINVRVDSGSTWLDLKSGQHLLSAKIPAKRSTIDSLHLKTAKSMSITGIVLPSKAFGENSRHSKTPFFLAVSRLDDVQVVSRQTDVLMQVLMWMLGLAVLLCGIGTLWIRRLRFNSVQQDLSLSVSKAQLLSSYDALDAAIVALDGKSRVITANKQVSEIIGLDLNPGDNGKRLIDHLVRRSDNSDRLKQLVAEMESDLLCCGEIDLKVSVVTSRDLVIRTSPIIDNDVVVGRIWLIHDVTDKRQLQSQLLHAQKMEAIGTLCSGIAHDFNNFLAAVSANIGIAQIESHNASDTAKNALTAGEDAVFRAANVVRQLLTFSKNNTLVPELMATNDFIQESSNLFRHLFDASITFTFDFDPQSPTILADKTMLEQVLINLCVNARDAMADGGTITLRTRSMPGTITEQNNNDHSVLRLPEDAPRDSAIENQIAVIEVQDTGEGMPPEILRRIFDPFFTTKGDESGTGLGLATSYGIISQHGGQLSCESSIGEGSVFRIRLPAYKRIALAKSVPPAPHIKVVSARVLIVDDDERVRMAAERLLINHGFQVTTASSGADALSKISPQIQSQKIDVVLLDLTMPEMNGWQVMQRIRSKYATLPVVMCSGYGLQTNQSGHPSSLQPDAYVAKPYRANVLIEALTSVIDKRAIPA